MTIADIPALRLSNQQISQTEFNSPSELVKYLGAVQAQDFNASKWGLGLRLPGISDAEIEKEFDEGRILRTHIMRPTWHFVAPEDIRWITELTAPRVKALCAFMNRKMELNEAIFKKTNKLITRALKGNNYLTRAEIGATLQKRGIAVNDLRIIYIIMRAELDTIICSGPRHGKLFTYALTEERAPGSKILKRDEAIAELAARYFISHGPAAMQDFAWWSGLAMSDAKAGIEMVKSELQKENIDGQTYWYENAMNPSKAPTTFLLPIFDEYIIAYKDRTAVFDKDKFGKVIQRGNVISGNTIVENGKVIGTWTRTIMKDKVVVKPITFIKPSRDQKKSIGAAADHYGSFLGSKAEINW